MQKAKAPIKGSFVELNPPEVILAAQQSLKILAYRREQRIRKFLEEWLEDANRFRVRGLQWLFGKPWSVEDARRYLDDDDNRSIWESGYMRYIVVKDSYGEEREKLQRIVNMAKHPGVERVHLSRDDYHLTFRRFRGT